MIITGGSRGIGAATAVLAAERGYAVAIGYVSDAQAAEAVVEKIRTGGGVAIGLQGDVSSESHVARLFETVDRELGPPGVLVNSAGIVDRQARLDQMNARRLQRMFEINVIGSMLCAAEAVRRMSSKNGAKYRVPFVRPVCSTSPHSTSRPSQDRSADGSSSSSRSASSTADSPSVCASSAKTMRSR